jgi:hypothetical protein
MNKIASTLGLLALLGSFSASPASAQHLVPGTWTGTMTPPGGGAIDVTYEVGESDGALSVIMRAAEIEGEMDFKDIRVEEGQMTFWWEPGIRVDCTLFATETGGFEGKCTDGTGPSGEGRLVMVPPGGGA